MQNVMQNSRVNIDSTVVNEEEVIQNSQLEERNFQEIDNIAKEQPSHFTFLDPCSTVDIFADARFISRVRSLLVRSGCSQEHRWLFANERPRLPPARSQQRLGYTWILRPIHLHHRRCQNQGTITVFPTTSWCWKLVVKRYYFFDRESVTPTPRY